MKKYSILLLLLTSCTPSVEQRLNKQSQPVLDINDSSGNAATLQILTLSGHQFAVLCKSSGCAICEVTKASLVPNNEPQDLKIGMDGKAEKP